MSDKKVKCPKCNAPEMAENPPDAAWKTVNIWHQACFDLEKGARHEFKCFLCKHEWEVKIT